MKYKLAGYIVFFMASLFFALYIQFPGQLFANYIENTFSKFRNLSLQVNSISLSLPWGLKSDSIVLNLLDTPVLHFENALFDFQMHSLFSENRLVKYKANVSNGIISGLAIFERKNSESLVLESRIENVMIENLNPGLDIWSCALSGLLNGQMDTSLNNGQVEEAQGTISLKNLLMDFSAKPLYSIRKFKFSFAQLSFTMPEQQLIRIKKLQMKGKQMDINASGDIMPAQNPKQSRLNMKALITLYPLFFMNAGSSLPLDISRDQSGNTLLGLKIEGTLQNPRISVNQELKFDGDVKL
ncbi:MAG: type II secretion system protein GspN [Desulfobacula sp.]|nr:type II secretion system protein GspN [Desulfobacula sp.]